MLPAYSGGAHRSR